MEAGNTQVGPNMVIVGKRYIKCKQSIMIIPMDNDTKYKITKVTKEREKRRDEIIKELKAILDASQILVSNYWKLENPYDGDFYNPWLLAQTCYGMIRIRWRYRVMHINWKNIKIQKIISNDDVTKIETMIHAESNAKAVEYLSNWINVTIKCGKE